MSVSHKFTSAKTDGADSTLVQPSDWNDTHLGNNLPVLLVATSDSPQKHKDAADYLCDGTADQTEINTALAAIPTTGGQVICAPGTYNLSGSISITLNRLQAFMGYGAKLVPASGVTAISVSQGASGTRGVTIEGFLIAGGNDATSVGIALVDTSWAAIRRVHIENVGVGILQHNSTTNNFVEGTTLEDIVIRHPITYGLEFRRTSGTNSFGQHNYRNVNISSGGGTATLVTVPSGCSLYRSRIQIGTWIDSSQTAFSFDGDFDNAVLDLYTEGSTGSTSNTSIVIGTNCTNLDRALNHWSFWGTIATNISNAFSKDYWYRSGKYLKGGHDNSTAPLRITSDNGSGDFFVFGLNGVAGGRQYWGNGTGSLDTYIERNAALKLVSNGKFDPASLNLQTKAGVPADGDVTGGAADGDIILDTTNNRLYVRSGGAWLPLGVQSLPTRGGSVLTPSAAVNVYVWRAPFACTVTNVRGIRRGGTGATINARRNGTSTHLASALSLTSADTWMDGGSVQNTAYAVGDSLEIMVVSVSGSPTEVGIQVDFTRP